MSLPTAAAPVAVLVLAWDETTPAVRALVEASEIALPLFDSVVVLVPAGPPDAEAISQEEFLPLDALPELPGSTGPAPAPEIAPLAPALLAPVAGPPADFAAPDLAGTSPAATVSVDTQPAAATATPETPLPAVATPTPPLTWSEVRVLRLSSFTLPELARRASQALPQAIWRGDLVSPAAPYVGQSTVATGDNLPALVSAHSIDYQEPAPVLSPATPLLSLAPLAQPVARPAQGVLASMPPNYFLGELPAPAIDAEPDLAPAPLAGAEEAPAAAAPAEPLATDFAATQADWPAALASLRAPALLPTQPEPARAAATEITDYAAEAETPVASAVPAPVAPTIAGPAPHQFDAPNLNFQVIQYARFAVPVALAEMPFGAIYAPAWPTWLAAQELRQRTGRPLVLHVASLAAPEGESVETATGWQAELQRQALHRADLILTETPALAHRLRHELSWPAHLVRPVSAADAAAIAQALHTARPRPALSMS